MSGILKNIITSIYDVLINDETLLRLLHYPPADLSEKRLDPLSDELPNIIVDNDSGDYDAIDKMWEIRDKHILLTSKSDDLEESQICRLYLYTGKTRPSPVNKFIVKQEIVIDIFCHSLYEQDQRMEAITDRLGTLLFYTRPAGLGRLDYRTGHDFVAPKEYRAYRHIYVTSRSKR